ncbi:hypothetical protein [Acidithiobacillus concretivorus]|uniref:Uncharacterized protein n=1 Tax=Acidithiobacillus concretivorus TaxID=3063952 RepID=A0ABS5ZTT0_9PROT|nr:hypothetical protein [Acidithiobacillus concretivorus]MBU2740053.1 hypothetical protein [Acidithiobacillus concretivorus]
MKFPKATDDANSPSDGSTTSGGSETADPATSGSGPRIVDRYGRPFELTTSAGDAARDVAFKKNKTIPVKKPWAFRDGDVTTNTGDHLRRIWGKNRPHPIASKFVTHYLEPALDLSVKILWLPVAVLTWLYFHYFTVHPESPVAIPIMYAFIAGGLFFNLSVVLYIFKPYWIFGYHRVPDKNPQMGRGGSYTRNQHRSADYSGLSSDTNSGCDINPANGFSMIGGCGGLDVQGNAYGTDMYNDFSSGFSSDDSFTSI